MLKYDFIYTSIDMYTNVYMYLINMHDVGYIINSSN